MPSTRILVALRERLAEARSRGESFGECWPAIVKGVLANVDAKSRADWRRALERTRTTWQRCYERVPATPGERALEQTRVLIERVPLEDRSCATCGDPVPAKAQHCAPCKRALDPKRGEFGEVGPRQVPVLAEGEREDWSEPEQLELVA